MDIERVARHATCGEGAATAQGIGSSLVYKPDTQVIFFPANKMPDRFNGEKMKKAAQKELYIGTIIGRNGEYEMTDDVGRQSNKGKDRKRA